MSDRTDGIPNGVTVYVQYNSYAHPSVFGLRHITCFRCGEYGHYRSDCMTYKTELCEDYKLGRCTAMNCTRAHGVSELREPWLPRCVRVVKVAGRVKILGCGRFGHMFRMCPYHGMTDG